MQVCCGWITFQNKSTDGCFCNFDYQKEGQLTFSTEGRLASVQVVVQAQGLLGLQETRGNTTHSPRSYLGVIVQTNILSCVLYFYIYIILLQFQGRYWSWLHPQKYVMQCPLIRRICSVQKYVMHKFQVTTCKRKFNRLF